MRSLEEIKPGQTIGRYEFLVPIAEGGMASVWAARMKGTRGFQKTLAVKMMLASLSDNPAFEQMFLDEARIASQIHHPNVVEIFDLGEENEVLYLVMEFVDGEPLSTIFRTAQKKSGIPVGVAVRVIADAAAGLHAAHELKDENNDDELLGLVHRDVSPQNILVSYDGTVKIVDFGVAKADGRSAEKTMAGTVKGKAPYMSPEQALGKEIDRRTDVFALGIVLYQLTTGKHPFRGENDIVTLHNIIEKQAPAPSSVVPSYPRPLEAVIMKALEKSPGKRFQSCAELEAALDRVMPPTAPRVRPADVGRFVRETVGDRGEKRREALRAAVRLADERLQNELDAAKLAAKPVSEIGLTQQVGAVSVSGVRSEMIPTSISNPRQSGPISGTPGSVTPASGNYSFDGRPSVPPTGSQPSITTMGSSSATLPPGPISGEAPPAKSKKGLVIGIGAFAAVVLAAVLFTTTRKSAKPTAATAPAETTQTAMIATAAKSATPTPATSATDSAPTPAASASAASSAEVAGIDPSALPAAGATGIRPSGPYDGKGRFGGPVADKDKDAKDKDKDKKKPTQGGFVPPPLTDPGF